MLAMASKKWDENLRAGGVFPPGASMCSPCGQVLLCLAGHEAQPPQLWYWLVISAQHTCMGSSQLGSMQALLEHSIQQSCCPGVSSRGTLPLRNKFCHSLQSRRSLLSVYHLPHLLQDVTFPFERKTRAATLALPAIKIKAKPSRKCLGQVTPHHTLSCRQQLGALMPSITHML